MKLSELLKMVQGDVRIYEWIPGADILRLSEPCIRDLYAGSVDTVPEKLLQRELRFIHGALVDSEMGMVNIVLKEEQQEGGTA